MPDPIDFTKTGVLGPNNFDTFGCNVFRENPDTPDRVAPDVRLVRKVFGSLDLNMPDGRKVRFWGFEDPNSRAGETFPSAPIRVRAGQIVHTRIESAKGSHTIHHHGLQPTTFNDGVGHVSFEVNGDYTYQWRPAVPGTYFYHCHKNTVLHFEMGMYGMLIVDPPTGPGKVFANGPAYDAEALWVADDVDPRWHELNQDAGLCGEDVGLNDFRPEYFMLSGVPHPRTQTSAKVVPTLRAGQTLLIRLLNASYSILRTRIGVDVEVVGVDGSELGSPYAPGSRPFTIRANEPFELTSAQRYALIVRPTATGEIPVLMEFLDWSRRRIQAGGKGIVRTAIRVNA